MLSLLQQILCAIQNLAWIIIDLLVAAVNLLIAAIGAALAGLLLLLPVMPDEPDPPSEGVLAFINWLIPFAPMLAFWGIALTLWVAFLAIQVALRWFRAL